MAIVTVKDQLIDERFAFICDFCGKTQDEVSILIGTENDSCHIFGNCVAHCMDTIVKNFRMPE